MDINDTQFQAYATISNILDSIFLFDLPWYYQTRLK